MKLASVHELKQSLMSTRAVPETLLEAFAGEPAVSRRSLREVAEFAELGVSAEIGVALGVARGRGKRDYHLGVTIHATPRVGAQIAAKIQRRAAGECQVDFVPRLDAKPRLEPLPPETFFRKRQRPLESGLSVGHVNITAGTLGLVVEDEHACFVLSNNHVLADVNQADLGDAIVQPGPLDAVPKFANLVAVLDRYVPISFKKTNHVDCAIAELIPNQEFYDRWTEALPGQIKGFEPITEEAVLEGLAVKKAGRTTDVTDGIVTQVGVDGLRVNFADPGRPPRLATFNDQIQVRGTNGAFSLGGDSGSLIVDESGWARALLFAGGQNSEGVDLTYANRIERVLDNLNVSLAIT